jgi:ADP-heptose:LPS heptosyltransferase
VYKRSRSYAYTLKVQREDGLHPIDGNLAMLRECGLQMKSVENDFHVPEANLREADDLLQTFGIGRADKYIFVQPFTSNPAKNWPLGNYLALAENWSAAGLKVLFGGGPGDRPQLEPALQNKFPSSAGASLLTSAALAKRSQFVIGGDTGLLHLAVAMGKRVLLLVNSPAAMALPYGHADWAVAPQAGQGIDGISCETVAERSREILFDDAQASQPAKMGGP